MSRNGSGVYNLPAGNPVVTGTTIASTWANNTMNDIAAALTDSVAADGQTPMTGDLDMNTNKIVNLDPGTVAGNAVEYDQFVNATTTSVNITGGTINGTTIGATTPASGRFTSIESTSGTINGTSIGATTAASGRFTTLESTSTLNVGTNATVNGTSNLIGNTTVGGTLTVTGLGAFNGTGALKIPVGTTGEQPTPTTGMIRFNSTNSQFEGYFGSSWNSLVNAINSGTAVASTSGTSIDFTNIPSTVKRITVMFDSVSKNGGAYYLIQLGTSTSIETTGYQAVSTYTGSTAGGSGTVTDGFPIFDNTAGELKSGALVFTLLDSSTNTWVCQGSMGQFVNQANYNMITNGNKSLSSALTRIRITTANGLDTFDNGKINILYE